MDKFNATRLTFGTGKMKSLLRRCVFLFFLPSEWGVIVVCHLEAEGHQRKHCD